MSTGDRPEWAQRLSRLRAERRWSRRDLAEQLRAAAARIGETQIPDADSLARNSRRWEAGQVRPDERYSALLADVYAAPSLAPPSWAADHPADADQLAYVAAGARPDTAAADALAQLVHHYRTADDTAPTGSLIEPVTAVARLADDLACTAATDRQQRAAGRTLAEAERLRWWTLTDLGRHQEAAAAHARAVAAAVEADYLPFVAHLQAARAARLLAAGDPVTAVRLARQARDPRWGASAAGRAWAATQEVRGHLAAGSPMGEVARAVDAAQLAYADVRPGDEPRWLYWLAYAPVLELEALDMRLVVEGPAVADDIEAALFELPAERARDHAWYRARLASAWARVGAVDEALAATARAVELARATGSTWPLGELQQLAEQPHLAALAEPLADA